MVVNPDMITKEMEKLDEVESDDDNEVESVDINDDKSVDNDDDVDSSDDEEPEDISLTASKKLAEESRRKEYESNKVSKDLKKQKLKERENRNVIQQQEKRSRKPESIVPEKLDEDLLELVDDELEIDTNKMIKINDPERKNKKIIFSDSDESGDEDEDEKEDGDDLEEDDTKEKVDKKQTVKVKYINEVHKEENNSAREFLKQHFFGDRIKREQSKKYRPRKKKGKPYNRPT